MKLPALIAAALTAMALPALAQQSGTDHPAHHPAQAQSAAALSDGEVRRIDKDAGKLTIRHGPIQNLDMPPMAMVFQVKDAAMLDKVKAGDRIRFRTGKSGSTYVVMQIETPN